MKIIIAPTYEDYVRCCHQNSLRLGVVPHIMTPTDVEKINDKVEPIYFGKFWEMPGIKAIEQMMKAKGILVRGKNLKTERYDQHDKVAKMDSLDGDPEMDAKIERMRRGEF